MKKERIKIESLDKFVKTPLVAALIGIVLLGTGVLLSLGSRIEREIENQAKHSMERVCVQNTKNVEHTVSSRQRALRALAAKIANSGETDAEEIALSLKSYSDIYGFYNLGYWEKDGKGCTTLDEQFDLGDEDYFLKALEGEESVTESRLSEDGQENLNIFAVPVRKDGIVQGVLTACYRSRDFLDITNSDFMSGYGQTIVIDREGMAVSLPCEKCIDGLCDIVTYITGDRELLKAAGKGGFLTFFFEGEEYTAYSQAIDVNEWCVLGYVPSSYLRSEVDFLRKKIAMALAVLYSCIIATVLLCIAVYRKLSGRIMELAFQDELTHAKNYEYLRVYFKDMTPAEKEKYYLVAFDIDKFKFINILYGTKRGDRLLRFILEIFEKTLPGEQVFKANADMFVALMKGDNDGQIIHKIKLLESAIRESIAAGDIFPFTLSFGVSKIGKGDMLRAVYDHALLAKKEVKHSLNHKYKFYDNVEEEKVRKREIETAFDSALENGEFKVWYQPKYDMRTGKICGSEALVRWQRPDGAIMPPGDFIPVLEENGRIVDLDEEVVKNVCRDLKEMEEKGLESGVISVNLSKIHLKRVGIVDYIREVVEEYGVDPQKITFEITESAADGGRKELNQLVDALQQLGFQVDMDDYGTGSSTLKSLSSTNFNTLKLDKSFIDEIGTEKIDIILRSTIQMARELAMNLVAEGVENEEQAEFLLANDCFVAQGYYFSRPLEKSRYLEALEENQRGGT